MRKKKILIAHVPVLHKGYQNLFDECGADTLCIIGEDVIASIPELDYVKRKDSIRAISPETIKSAIGFSPVGRYFAFINIMTMDKIDVIKNILMSKDIDFQIVMPDEDVSRAVAEKYFPDQDIEFLPIFLRWNNGNVTKQAKPNCPEISPNEFEKTFMKLAIKEGDKSLDWWRQVGGVLVKDDEIVLVAHNKHLPCDQTPYVLGDPRSVFTKGIHFELSTSEHSEARLIAESARRGICLEGASLFTTDFPCPPCAKLVARSGIKKIFFCRGYGVLDGEDIMRNAGVEIFFINEESL